MSTEPMAEASLWQTHRSALRVFFVLAAWFTVVPLVSGEIFADAEYTERFAPWRDDVATAESKLTDNKARYANYWRSLTEDDLFLSVYPAHLRTRELARAGQIPLWDDRTLGGVPLWANGMVQPLSPMNWLAWALPPWSGWMLKLFLELMLCLCAFYAFFRRRTETNAAAVAAAVVFVFNPAFIRFLPYGTVVGGFAFVALSLLAVERVFRSPQQGRVLALLALSLAAMLLTTNLQFALYGLLLVGLWTLWCGYTHRQFGGLPIKALLMAGAIAVCLSAVHLLPSFELVGLTGRDPSKYAGANFIEPALLASLWVPLFYGSPAGGSYVGGELFFMPPSTTFVLSLGTAAVALAVLGAFCSRLPGRRVQVALMVGPLIVFVASKLPFVLAILEAIPGYTGMLALRSLVLSYFALALLLAGGIDALVHNDVSRAARRNWAIVMMAGICVVVVAMTVTGHTPAQPHWMVPVAVLVSLGLFVLRGYCSAWVLVGLLCVEAAVLFAARVDTAKPDVVYPDHEQITGVRALIDKNGGRMVGLTEEGSFPQFHGDHLPPNTASVYGLSDIRGFVPLSPGHVEQAAALVKNPERPAHFLAALHFDDVSSPWFDAMNVRYALSNRSELGTRWVPVSPGIFENTKVLERVRYVPCARAVPSADKAIEAMARGVARNTVLISAGEGCLAPADATAPVEVNWLDAPGAFEAKLTVPGNGGYLVVADTWYPGWTATINDAPADIMLANGSVRAVLLPPGLVTVRMTYESEVWTIGGAASLLGLLLLALVARRRTAK